MGVVMSLGGFAAPNIGLPVAPIYNREGLLLAIRPRDSADSMENLANSGVTLTAIGAPSFDSQGVIVNNANGYRLNIPDPKELTAIVVFSLSGGAAATPLIGNYDSAAPGGIMLKAGSPTSGRVGSNAHRWNGSANANTQNVSDNDYDGSGLIWAAMRLTGSTMSLFDSAGGVLSKKDSAAYDYANRVIGANNLGIGAGVYSTWSSAAYVNVSEVLLYERGMADDEIWLQRERSKALFTEQRKLVWPN
ncbi:hypothetical protein ABEB22_18260 (plasmid) [Thioclava sp. 'Guangxiensis']|uniref:hypothetical protein n=1 Tax=Thioclava sp. 'Guangxiensis' TaxID=3149044 RepID=UPI0032C42029